MLKTFTMHISLPLEQSYDLFFKSGSQINAWRASNSNPENGYIEWKQSFWALTGTSIIAVQLEQINEQSTSAVISVHKPLQVFDPAGICKKIFKKLLKSLGKCVNQSDEYSGCTIKLVETDGS